MTSMEDPQVESKSPDRVSPTPLRPNSADDLIKANGMLSEDAAQTLFKQYPASRKFYIETNITDSDEAGHLLAVGCIVTGQVYHIKGKLVEELRQPEKPSDAGVSNRMPLKGKGNGRAVRLALEEGMRKWSFEPGDYEVVESLPPEDQERMSPYFKNTLTKDTVYGHVILVNEKGYKPKYEENDGRKINPSEWVEVTDLNQLPESIRRLVPR